MNELINLFIARLTPESEKISIIDFLIELKPSLIVFNLVSKSPRPSKKPSLKIPASSFTLSIIPSKTVFVFSASLSIFPKSTGSPEILPIDKLPIPSFEVWNVFISSKPVKYFLFALFAFSVASAKFSAPSVASLYPSDNSPIAVVV